MLDVRAISINVTLWLNIRTQDWSVMLNDTIHKHVSMDIVESLVESHLIAAELSLVRDGRQGSFAGA